MFELAKDQIKLNEKVQNHQERIPRMNENITCVMDCSQDW
jgi:hypothetical protein